MNTESDNENTIDVNSVNEHSANANSVNEHTANANSANANAANTNTESSLTELHLGEAEAVRRDKLKELRSAGKDPFAETAYTVTHSTDQIIEGFEQMDGQPVRVAGRLMSKRGMGKAGFGDVLDRGGRIQIYVRLDEIGEQNYEEYKKYDIGDIIGVAGAVFKTHKGEISVRAAEVKLLAKSLLPLPEKYHGLKDTDLRYRQRYVDLIVNGGVRDAFVKRSRIIKSIRQFMDGRGYLEVETPLLNTIQCGATARPFATHHNTLDMDLFLRIAPELFLKRLIVGGLERVYEIGRCFRNEGMDVKHNPEFTMLELYQAYTDYNGMMELIESLIKAVALDVTGRLDAVWQGAAINLGGTWPKITMEEAVFQRTGINFAESNIDTFNGANAPTPAPTQAPAPAPAQAPANTDRSVADMHQLCEAVESYFSENGVVVEIKPGIPRGELLNLVFEECVESTLVQPTFIYDYPVEISPFAKRKPGRPGLTERFELFINGAEFANAFTELNDPDDQRSRMMDQAKRREAGDDEANMLDEDYVRALEYGLPPTGGLGMGVDRLAMLLTDSYSIRDVILFPTMKPHNK